MFTEKIQDTGKNAALLKHHLYAQNATIYWKRPERYNSKCPPYLFRVFCIPSIQVKVKRWISNCQLLWQKPIRKRHLTAVFRNMVVETLTSDSLTSSVHFSGKPRQTSKTMPPEQCNRLLQCLFNPINCKCFQNNFTSKICLRVHIPRGRTLGYSLKY